MAAHAAAGCGSCSLKEICPSPELRLTGLEWVSLQENVAAGGTASRLGNKCLCRATSLWWLFMLGLEGGDGTCILLFLEKSPNRL